MDRRVFYRLCLAGGVWACSGIGRNAGAAPSQEQAQLIERLIGRVESMTDMVFIRNGTETPAKAAANHLRDKYDYFRSDIATAEDFIRLCATRSEMTHRPYKVRLRSGVERLAAEWLHDELLSIQKAVR